MDVFEKLYQKISQHELFKTKPNHGELRLQDVVKYLDVFANSLSKNAYQIQCVASRDFVGLYGAKLFLPEKINYFRDIKLNKMLYQNLILQTIGAHHLGLMGPSAFESSIIQRLNFLKHSSEINLFLDNILPGYQEFQVDLIKNIKTTIDVGIGYQKQVYKFWEERVLARTQLEFSAGTLIKSARARDPVPRFLLFTVPSLERAATRGQKLGDLQKVYRQKKEGKQSEVKKAYSGINQEVDLEKEQANPVMHSFEKLETADEYSGGRTMDSGDDEINDHAKALDELNLTKVTRGGEAAKSVFNADTSIDFELLHAPLEKGLPGGHFYPEWNYKKNYYMKDHCQLVEDPLSIKLGDEDFKKTLMDKYRFQIKHWQSRIQALFSEPLWLKKLTEGDEIDIDEVIRDLGSMQRRQNVTARWYMSRKKQFNDTEIVILFDQSQSSDSWVGNRRVLDITLEAVGNAGLLFDQIFEDVTVAGIWSSTRHNCSFQIYKRNREPWSTFYKKVSAIEPQGYTRLGPAIRHAAKHLQKSVHKKKLILLLTDGKPTDVDGYEGPTGINDVAQACREAEVSGILHYALVLDTKQQPHFSKMFKHFVLLHDPRLFSEELFKILFRLIKL